MSREDGGRHLMLLCGIVELWACLPKYLGMVTCAVTLADVVGWEVALLPLPTSKRREQKKVMPAKNWPCALMRGKVSKMLTSNKA
eukprot:1147574-Pelagomonas_calceolata.AAC.2